MKLQLAKGVRDLAAEDAILMQEIVGVLKRNFQAFGYNPLQTPIIERFDTLSSKYTGGSEILKETFALTDQGKRKLGLRYDLTVPFARFVGMNPQLKLPYKRYQIGRVFRDGPIKANRYREFSQCDCDVVGNSSIAADAEIVELYLKCFSDLGIKVFVQVNNRKILDELMETLEIKPSARGGVILAIDKIQKKSRKDIEKEIINLGVEKKAVDVLFDVFSFDGKKAFSKVKKILDKDSQGVKEMEELLTLCPYKSVIFTPSLARGLAYYTGTVYEAFVADKSITSSIGGGGRYDKMIGALMGSKQTVPAVGGAFGLDVMINALKIQRKKVRKSVVKLLVVPIGLDVSSVWSIVKELREEGIPTDIGTKKGISKNIKYADSYGIEYVLFIGEDELKSGKYKLKNLEIGKEKNITISSLIRMFS